MNTFDVNRMEIPDDMPSPGDLIDILTQSIITNIINIYGMDNKENLKNIINLNNSGKNLLLKLVGSFNFYFVHYWTFLSQLHPSMLTLNKDDAYSEKKQMLIDTILSKLDTVNISYDREKMIMLIGTETFLDT